MSEGHERGLERGECASRESDSIESALDTRTVRVVCVLGETGGDVKSVAAARVPRSADTRYVTYVCGV